MLKHLEVIGNGSASISHFYKAIQFIKNKRNRYNFADIITNKYRLDQANGSNSSDGLRKRNQTGHHSLKNDTRFYFRDRA